MTNADKHGRQTNWLMLGDLHGRYDCLVLDADERSNMEMFGLLFSCPAGFVATLIYATLLRKSAAWWPWISVWFRGGSVVVFSMLAIEVLLLCTFGAKGSQRLLGPGFYAGHSVVFFLGTPALANLLVLQKRVPFLGYPFVAAIPCAILAFFLTLMEYYVWETLFFF